ncbi:uncharacterized protein LOC119096938 [Pollicipes pollicipes]|uniref:uncharacterized protein LOC119096938 n=1 Tax=Pollicipes pollicipes TaxID=41117 RepID=UPI001884C8E0|nr:uncharacterized protein LOC119096938 [Pollicipes pollicipes]
MLTSKRWSAKLLLLLLRLAASSPSAPAQPCCENHAPRSSQERQMRLPDGFTMAIEPKLFFNMFDSETEGKLRVQTRLEFRYRPPAGFSGRQARQAMDRVAVFSSLRAALSRFGLDGQSCLQRAVCETSGTPDHSDGLLGELVTLVLSPSRGLAGQAPDQLAPLLEAERRGRTLGPDGCSALFPSCPVSLFNFADRAADYTGALLDLMNVPA